MYFLVFGLFCSTSSWTFFRVSTSCRGLSFFIHGSILFHECDVIYLPTVVLIDIELIPVGSYYKESYCEHFFPCVILDTGWHFSRIYSLMSSGSRTRQMSSFRTYGKHFKVLKQFILPPKYMVGIVVPLSHEHLEYSGLFKNSGRYILVIHCDFNFNTTWIFFSVKNSFTRFAHLTKYLNGSLSFYWCNLDISPSLDLFSVNISPILWLAFWWY